MNSTPDTTALYPENTTSAANIVVSVQAHHLIRRTPFRMCRVLFKSCRIISLAWITFVRKNTFPRSSLLLCCLLQDVGGFLDVVSTAGRMTCAEPCLFYYLRNRLVRLDIILRLLCDAYGLCYRIPARGKQER